MRDDSPSSRGKYLKAPHKHIRQKLNVQLYVDVVGVGVILPSL